MADERYRADNYGRHGSEQTRGASRRHEADQASGRHAQGESSWGAAADGRDRYPSGRPRTQPVYRDEAGAEAPRYSEGGYSARARSGQAGSYNPDGFYRRSEAGYGQDSYGQGARGAYEGYRQDGQAGYEDYEGYGSYEGRPQRGAAQAQDDRARGYSDGRDGRAQGHADRQAGRYGQGEPSGHASQHGRHAQDGAARRGGEPNRAHGASQAPERGRAAAPAGANLPEPLARALDTLRDNPVIVAAAAAAVALIVVIALVASCVAGNAQQGYVQAVSSSQGSDSTAQTDAAASTSDTADAGSAAPADDAATPDATQAADAATGTDAAAQQADPSDQSPHDVDDVTAVEDVWSYSTTSFNKDAAYNNGGVEDPWSPTGYFTTGDAELDQMVKGYCDGQAQDGLDAGDNAYYTYLHISWIDYVENDQNQRPWDVEGDWRVTYAKQCFTNMTANCYEFAAAIQYIMRYYGYADAIAEPCLVLKQSGAWGDHGLVFLTSLDGRQCLIDASLSSNGWLLPAASMSYKLDSGYRAS